MTVSATHARLGVFVDGWVELAKMLTFADIRRDQKPPWAGVCEGAAGYAYALWYVASRRGAPAKMTDGQRWSRFAAKGARRRSGLARRRSTRVHLPLAASVPFGRPGLHVVDALVAHGADRPIARTAALASFTRAMRRARKAPTEFMAGTAGGLTAALALHRVTGDATMRALADDLARALLRAPAMTFLPFAHGTAGVQHALLAWSQLTGAALPEDFANHLAAPSDNAIIARAPHFAGSWCNGLPGYVLLWTRAYEVTGDDRWRRRARQGMQRVREMPTDGNGTLCCGLGGRAYAALALARIDASEDWHALATELCTGALALAPSHGLFQGLAGIVCLATDLITPGEARFPLVEP